MTDSSPDTLPHLLSASMDYRLWDDGQNSTSVACFADTGAENAQRHDDGLFRHHLKLESRSPFSVLRTVTLTAGPLKGYQVIVVDQKPPFRFLGLPREIRDEIYTYAMAPELKNKHQPQRGTCNDNSIYLTTIIVPNHDPPRSQREQLKRFIPECTTEDGIHHLSIYCTGDIPGPFTGKESLTPSLLVANRQLYEEALPILYGRNTFKVIPEKLDPFLKQIGPAKQFIRTLYLHDFRWCGLVKKRELMSQLVSLNRLYVGCQCLNRLEEDLNAFHMASKFYKEAYKWIELVGVLHGDPLAASKRTYLEFEDHVNCDRDEQARLDQADRVSLMKDFRTELKRQSYFYQAQLPFLTLPRHIRDRIYRFAMHPSYEWQEDDYDMPLPIDAEEGIQITYLRDPNKMSRKIDEYDHEGKLEESSTEGFHLRESLTPGLLLANRQVHYECLPILYGNNEFVFPRRKDLQAFLQRIKGLRIYLRAVKIDFWPELGTLWLELVHLRSMTIRISIELDG